MIPIGAPVTATSQTSGCTDSVSGTLTQIEEGVRGNIYCVINDWFVFRQQDVKIRYDAPAHFTLWQLNAIMHCDANHSWLTICKEMLAPENIHAVWNNCSVN